MNRQQGFTLVELLLAITLSTMVIGIVTYLVHGFFSEQRSLEVWSNGQLEMSAALKDLDGDIRNIVRFEPTDNLASSGSAVFFGMTSIPQGREPSVCLNESTASVVRYTSLDRRLRSERLLRAWSEVADANKTAATNELRLTADDTEKSLFTAQKAPPEITIVDADRRYIRRYRVSSHSMHLNSSTDPYTGLPATDANGNAMTFNYASILLKAPLNVSGSDINLKTAVFITGSEIYASNTYYVCLRKTDRSLIKYNEVTKQVDVLLQNPQADFAIDAFTIGYHATKSGVRVEPGNFIADMLSASNNQCFNTLLLKLQLKASESYITRSKSQGLVDTKTEISRTRTVFSQNLNVKRPVSCL